MKKIQLLFSITKNTHFLMLLGVILLMATASCKSIKPLNQSSVKNLSAKKIIRNHNKNQFAHKTVSATLHVVLKKENTLSANIRLRVEKDQKIWMSVSKLGIGIAKFVATKDSVKFYNKLNKTYFAGDYRIVEKLLGMQVDFFQLQNLLLGQAVVELKPNHYQLFIEKNGYQLHSIIENESMLSYLFLLDPIHFKIRQQKIHQLQPSRILNSECTEYQQIKKTYFPKKMKLTSQTDSINLALNILFKRVVFDQTLSFPFRIPDNYLEINDK